MIQSISMITNSSIIPLHRLSSVTSLDGSYLLTNWTYSDEGHLYIAHCCVSVPYLSVPRSVASAVLSAFSRCNSFWSFFSFSTDRRRKNTLVNFPQQCIFRESTYVNARVSDPVWYCPDSASDPDLTFEDNPDPDPAFQKTRIRILRNLNPGKSTGSGGSETLVPALSCRHLEI